MISFAFNVYLRNISSVHCYHIFEFSLPVDSIYIGKSVNNHFRYYIFNMKIYHTRISKDGSIAYIRRWL